MEARELTPSEWAILALLCERDAHGWALVRSLASDGEIGRVWSVKRALVYRGIEVLSAWSLVEAVGTADGLRGPNRTIMRVTEAGRRTVAEWLAEPVVHVRDARSLLLLKLLFQTRSKLDFRPLLREQAQVLARLEAALEEQVASNQEPEAMMASFRLEMTRAVSRFVATFSASPPTISAD
jgi:DNA-binding PadR family transcriptional regulator